MRTTAPKGQGIIAVATLFGIIGGGVSYVAFDFSFVAALFTAIVIAALVMLLLWVGWRDENPQKANAPRDVNGAAPTAAAPTAAAPTATAPVAEAPAASVAAAATTTAAATSANESAAASDTPPAATSAGDRVKPSTVLPGEADLAARKGDWKYEGGTADTASGSDASAAGTPAATAATEETAATAATDETAPKPAGEAKAPAKPKAKAKAPAEAADAGEGTKPEMLTAARDGGPDNLKEIKGVGPKLEAMLHDMGVFHFDQVASWGAAEVAWMDSNLKGFKGRVSRDTWIAQAKILAAGGETEFSKKVDKGGVY